MGILREFFVVILAVLAIIIIEHFSTHDAARDFSIPSNVDLNPDALPTFSVSQRYMIDILAVNTTINYRRARKMLAQSAGTDGVAFYSMQGVGDITASAEGVNQVQRFVHQYFDGYQPFSTDNIMVPLYALAQRKAYALDDDIYRGRKEVWQSSREAFFYPKGDCEDHAVLLADWLIEMGEDARVVVGRANGGGHAWVVLFRNGKEYLLEATRKKRLGRLKMYPLTKLHPNYQPSHMFNREFFWQNTGSQRTTHYSGEQWKKQSHFRLFK